MATARLFDTHIHTSFSTDSRMTLEEAIAKSRELSLGLTLTEHMDLDFPAPTAFVFNVDDYFRSYEPYRSELLGLGIEIGMRMDLVAENRAVVKDRPFDYVLGSIHVIDKTDIYEEVFYAGRTKRELYGRYFESMLACVRSHEFIDSLGHIDYIARYARFDDPELRYAEFPDYIDAVLGALAGAGKALEINTRRLANKETGREFAVIYRRFYELGGRLVTIGSDAHDPKTIGHCCAAALELASACGLKAVWFRERRPQYA